MASPSPSRTSRNFSTTLPVRCFSSRNAGLWRNSMQGCSSANVFHLAALVAAALAAPGGALGQAVQPAGQSRPVEDFVAPTFPGAVLFNDQPPFLAGVAVDRADGIYRDGDKLHVQ